MHAASLASSDRLRRVDAFLADRVPHSTLEIMQGARVCAVSALVSELRENGRKINCTRKGRIWYYRRIQ